MSRRIVFVLFCALVAIAPQVSADERKDVLDKQAYDLYQQVFSPFCPGRSLNDCPSSKAHELKLEMRAQLESGVPPQTILEGVFAKFGEKYRAIPAYEGFGKLVWWVPLGFLVLGLALACGLVGRRARRDNSEKTTAASTNVTPQIAPEIQAQIDRELSSLD